MQLSTAFIPGLPPAAPRPFGRYLPPLEEGVAATWLGRENIPAGQGVWVLDPFGASPHLAVEAARAGYSVLVAANNPVARFLLEMYARPPAHASLQAALSDLAAAYKGSERLEPHLRALYRTECANCGKEVMAEAFLWERGATAPYGRIYHCPYCDDSGEHPATEQDVARAAQFSSGGLHWARALERVATPDDPDRAHAEEALSMYLPRAVYALFSLINKLDGLREPSNEASQRRRAVEALLLTACDMGSALWPYPVARERPRKLAIPIRFRENNIWLALEEAVTGWSSLQAGGQAPVPVAVWPELPAPGGICLYTGRLKELASAFQESSSGKPVIAAVVTALPRPNQAFWTLSALWAGWLWGREASAPFKSVLRRRRYDWGWHTTALSAAFASLPQLLAPKTPLCGLVGEIEASFSTAAAVAGNLAGLKLDGIALREESGQAQLFWRIPDQVARPASAEPDHDPGQARENVRLAARALLHQRGEPCSSLHLQAAGLISLAQSGLISGSESSPAEIFTQIQNTLQQFLTDKAELVRYGGAGQSTETGQWWLRNGESLPGDQTSTPLADRVEISLVRALQKQPGITAQALDALICADFPGLLTPGIEVIHVCLASYGEQDPPGSGQWRLNASDTPRLRRADLAAMLTLLHQLGQRLGFATQGDHPQVWKDPSSKKTYSFYILASAVIGNMVLSAPEESSQKLIVIPGSRSGLVNYKLENDLRLAEAVQQAGWRFVKFRLLRRLAESSRLNRQNLDEQLALDPLSSTDPQLPLL